MDSKLESVALDAVKLGSWLGARDNDGLAVKQHVKFMRIGFKKFANVHE